MRSDDVLIPKSRKKDIDAIVENAFEIEERFNSETQGWMTTIPSKEDLKHRIFESGEHKLYCKRDGTGCHIWFGVYYLQLDFKVRPDIIIPILNDIERKESAISPTEKKYFDLYERLFDEAKTFYDNKYTELEQIFDKLSPPERENFRRDERCNDFLILTFGSKPRIDVGGMGRDESIRALKKFCENTDKCVYHSQLQRSSYVELNVFDDGEFISGKRKRDVADCNKLIDGTRKVFKKGLVIFLKERKAKEEAKKVDI